MTEKELIEQQEAAENRTVYLMKVGLFFHAYNAGAYVLARVMRYRIKRKTRKGGTEVLTAGFPVDSLDKVVKCLEEAGGTVVRHSDRWIEVGGLDGSPEDALVDKAEAAPGGKSNPSEQWKQEILTFDLVRATPLEAMNFLYGIQKELREQIVNIR